MVVQQCPTAKSTPSLSVPNWNTSCTTDQNGNPALLFTLQSSALNAGDVYAQACLDPAKIQAGVYDKMSNSAPQATDV